MVVIVRRSVNGIHLAQADFLESQCPLTIPSAAAADTLKGCPRLLRIRVRKGQKTLSKDTVRWHLSFD